MVSMGVWAFNNMPTHFRVPPGEGSKLIYNRFYLVPYAGMALALTFYAILGISPTLRIWLAAASLGVAVFCLFFINSGVAGHDFGHVIFGGCLQSIAMERLVLPNPYLPELANPNLYEVSR